MVSEVKQSNALEKAKAELQEEREKKMVARYKELLRQRESAQIVVNNLDREIAELEHEFKEGVGL